GLTDYIGAFAVSAGHEIDVLAEKYKRENDDYMSIMTKAIGDRLAEGLAEMMHKRVRDYCGYGRTENLTSDQLIREEYRGIRPAPGYPACPEHTEKVKLMRLLEAAKNSGVTLTENMAMAPASSVSGYYFNYDDAKYFTVSQLGRDQIEDYAKRKGMSVAEVEKWLAPVLGY
ncbi:MAG: vitamin B12 dependent-methionine synthase activation domain-containing protein, partial [Bdellovibrionota bacterium]